MCDFVYADLKGSQEFTLVHPTNIRNIVGGHGTHRSNFGGVLFMLGIPLKSYHLRKKCHLMTQSRVCWNPGVPFKVWRMIYLTCRYQMYLMWHALLKIQLRLSSTGCRAMTLHRLTIIHIG
ncbi:hypothetical protein AB205_0118210 [Aquarana catesbeiana]|uniref:Uncharacterized protein n=1 Tax=Aquarana catesbeiana TaxID=8400 RepID=A0A2G9RGL8_AQUCT|nr:hypothetical protein AB205_0118210 [Aquarana catesbeiana]